MLTQPSLDSKQSYPSLFSLPYIDCTHGSKPAVKMSDRLQSISSEEALAIIRRFFPSEWGRLQASDVLVSRPQSGHNNDVFFVSRLTPAHKEPNKLVLRKYSSISAGLESADKKPAGGMRATPLEQIVMMTEIANKGLGPKILGIFDDGRIEEFIDCHMISFEEARDPILEIDIAKNMARIHAIDVPLPKPGYLFTDALRILHQDLKDLIHVFDEIGDAALVKAVHHDFEADIKKLEPLLDLTHNRVVLMNWDPHLDNIAVRHDVKDGQLKTLIFDFENASCNIRGKDLGLFLISRSGFFPAVREDRRLESAEEFKPFLKAYQDEVILQFSDHDLKGVDSMDHLMMESLAGGLVSCFSFFLLIAIVVAKKRGVGCESMMKVLPVLLEGAEACKSGLRLL